MRSHTGRRSVLTAAAAALAAPALPALAQQARRRIRFTENVFYEFRDDKIAAVWSIIDKAAIEDQLGPA